MANGRNSAVKASSGRDSGGFVALPWSVLDCPAFAELSHPAKSLLLEVARQFVRDNNGRLLLSSAYLSKRGWRSADVITRAKRELLAAGFIFETVMGHRPNKASWYAVTWHKLNKIAGYDEGATFNFQQGAYKSEVLQSKPTRDQLYDKWRDVGSKPGASIPAARVKNETLSPRRGVDDAVIAPSCGIEVICVAPSGGAVAPEFDPGSTPSNGNHLEMPSYAPRAH